MLSWCCVLCDAVPVLCDDVPVLCDAVPVLCDTVLVQCGDVRGTYEVADRKRRKPIRSGVRPKPVILGCQ
jgi:hypothetical protein